MGSRTQRKAPFHIHTTGASAWITDPINSPDEEDDKQHVAGTFCCLLRVIQFGFIFLLLYASFILVKTFFFVHIIHPTAPPTISLIEGVPSMPSVARSTLRDPPSSTLLRLKNFTLLHEPDENLCAVSSLLFVMMVHSKPDHFQQRHIIRSTWGSLKHFSDTKEKQQWATRSIFILGEISDREEYQPTGIRPNVRDLVEDESKRWKDIVLGSFLDNYHNLRYKHVLGLRYAVEHCSNSIFFLKADDDAFIDIPGLYYYLVRTFGSLNNKMKDILAGNVFPSGTTPQRKGKWEVKASEYPWCEYPSYLGGLAYLMTPDIARDLYRIAHSSIIPEVWIDDVWITGLLAHTLGIRPLYLNPLYSYDHDEMREWLDLARSRARPPHHPPYTFAHLDPSRKGWKAFSQSLWKEVLAFYSLTVDSNRESERKSYSRIIHDVIG